MSAKLTFLKFLETDYTSFCAESGFGTPAYVGDIMNDMGSWTTMSLKGWFWPSEFEYFPELIQIVEDIGNDITIPTGYDAKAVPKHGF